ncbi:MAG: SBBP repeat-containing protein [Terriglobales bacterium]
MKAAFLTTAVIAAAIIVFYFGTTVHTAKAVGPQPAAHQAVASKSFSLPMFFEPNQGQTDPQVKFLARGSGYGLFLTADEAVLKLHRSAASSQSPASSVIRMKLDGANGSARVSGASPLPGKSNYFIGNDPSKWQSGIPQFSRVEYQSVYPGVDLVYYGNQGQLEYDFRVAPAADPSQIALSFEGASAHIVPGDSGDLILSTGNGDVRFHAPRIYQPAAPESGNASGKAEKIVAGSFRQLADNKIGFAIGDYDHSRELVIDPLLTYSTYLGGSGTENLVQIAVDPSGLIYVAGSTNSTDFPVNIAAQNNPTNPPYQANLGSAGATNIFIAVLNTTLQPPTQNSVTAQLVYATYLGGSETTDGSTESDLLAGLAVDTNNCSTYGIQPTCNIYVAGSTNSSNFPTSQNAFQTGPPTLIGPALIHGFLTKIGWAKNAETYGLLYSTYLAGTNENGNATDTVTGLAIDTGQNAYVTGVTTSDDSPANLTNPISTGFPATTNAFQSASNALPGQPQFFASKILTTYSGPASMIYSTYFGGGNFPVGADLTANKGGGIAVDPSPNSTPNIYFTGTTNMLPGIGPGGQAGFPLYDAQQSCLDQAGVNGKCNTNQAAYTDAFVAKINPFIPKSNPVYSTYLGGSADDVGLAIAVDTSSNAYVTGSTDSGDWNYCTGIQCTYEGGGNSNAFIAKIGNLTGATYPLTYFTYLGGTGPDVGNAILVDSVQSVHLVGTTGSVNDFPITKNTYQPCLGEPGVTNCVGDPNTATDAFFALISTGGGAGNYVSYLGGSQAEQGTGVALDIYGNTYVGGSTQSTDFPVTPTTAFQAALDGPAGGPADAFVSQIGSNSILIVTNPSTSPSPNPVPLGQQVAFTFDIANNGPDIATHVNFTATVPATGLTNVQAKITSGGTGSSCTALQGATISCYIPTLSVCTTPCSSPAAVEVDVTTSGTAQPAPQIITVSGVASANGGPAQITSSQTANVEDFTIGATAQNLIINAGDFDSIQVTFCPSPYNYEGIYSGTITPSESVSPSMVTSPSPSFSPTPVTLSGSTCGSTSLGIQTVARPVNSGSLLRRGSFYATWLPLAGLSLAGLSFGGSSKRRRWLIAVVLCLIAATVLLQPGCSAASTNSSTNTGTLAGPYTFTITGSAGTGSSHSTNVIITVR